MKTTFSSTDQFTPVFETKSFIIRLLFAFLFAPLSFYAQTWGGSTTQANNTFRTGNVGIGTTNPTNLLDIRTNSAMPGGVDLNGVAYPATYLPEIKLTRMVSNSFIGGPYNVPTVWEFHGGTNFSFAYSYNGGAKTFPFSLTSNGASVNGLLSTGTLSSTGLANLHSLM